MVFFVLGVLSLVAVMAALGAFSRAQVTSIKQMLWWVLALGGLLLATLLLFTRGPAGLTALVFLGPLLWSWVRPRTVPPGAGTGPQRPVPRGAMTREEAWQVLGLRPGASVADIRAAHRRLMRGAHPDTGGSDWLAARINQARDILLG
jgi:hypothetical protein